MPKIPLEAPMESLRRGILLACICLAVVAAKLAVLKPLIRVQPVDFVEKQKDESKWTEEGQRLAGLGLDAYIAEKSKGLLIPVAGTEWERIFDDMKAVEEGSTRNAMLRRRVPSDERKYQFVSKSLYYRPGEAPLAGLASRLRAEHDVVYLSLRKGGAVAYLEATLHTFSGVDFRFGTGFSHAPKPPTGFVFPYRPVSLWILLFGLAAYVLLPRRKIEKDALGYPTWRNVMGDIASLLLFVPFFAMPFLIVGGAVQAITQGWILCLIFWPLALLGVWLLRRMAWYASYLIVIRQDAILIKVGKSETIVPLADIAGYHPLILTSPRWLVIASLLAALSGRGSAGVGAAGRALVLAGSSYNGLSIDRKDGSSCYLWISDAMGSTALKNAGNLVKTLERAGIPRKKEAVTIRSVAPPVGRDKAGKMVKEGSEMIIWVLAGVPVLAMLIFLMIVMFGRAF
jgi:hypothetical protein